MKSKAKSGRLRCAQGVSESLSFMYSQALDKIIVPAVQLEVGFDSPHSTAERSALSQMRDMEPEC